MSEDEAMLKELIDKCIEAKQAELFFTYRDAILAYCASLKSLNEELVKRNENLIECLREIFRIWQEHPKLSPNYQLNWKVRDLIGLEALTQDSAKSGG